MCDNCSVIIMQVITMSKSICFMARPSLDKFTVKLFLELKKSSNVCAYFVVMNKKEEEYVRKMLNGENAIIFQLADYMEANWESFDINGLLDFEEKYNCAPMWKYIYTDRFLVKYDYEYVVKTTVGLFSFFEEIFEINDIDVYYDETIATLLSYIAFFVSKKYSTRYICQMTARGSLDSVYHYFINDPFQMNMLFEEDYKDKSYPFEIIEEAERYLTEFENKDVKPSLMSLVKQKPKLGINELGGILRYLKNRFNPLSNNRYCYIYYKDYKRSLDPLKFYFKYQKSKKYYCDADYNCKYVYFPLHYQPEASTLVCAEKYEKQLFFIDSWAKSLPADTKLYVKEHYALLGHRDLNFYKELQNYPNVVLVNPLENTRRLIEEAVAVTTLTGTAGWEAMLLRKPVFLGGRIFYMNAPGVVYSEDIFDQYIPNISCWSQPTRDDLVKYLCEYFSTLRKGNVYTASNKSLTETNIRNVALSLLEQIQ